VAALLDLQVPAQELFDQTEPLLQERWVRRVHRNDVQQHASS
jgi:hypothetical protein